MSKKSALFVVLDIPKRTALKLIDNGIFALSAEKAFRITDERLVLREKSGMNSFGSVRP